MKTRRQPLTTWLSVLTCGVFATAAGAAETPLSMVSASCQAIPANRTVDLTTARIMTTGQSVVLAVAVDSADAPDLTVTGPSGVAWVSLGGQKSESRNRSVVLLRGTASASTLAGATITLNFGQVESARTVCAQAMRYSSFISGSFALASDGQNQGTAAASPDVTAKQPVSVGMAVGAFLYEGNTNALTLNAGAVLDGGACNAALDLCLRVAHQGDVSGAVSLSMTPATTSEWQASLAVLATPGLFKDGFE